jgi:copper chaperone CopZ
MKRIIIAIALMAGMSALAMENASAEASVQILKKSKKEYKEVVFNVHLHCANCVRKVEENIAFEKGVKGLEVSLEKQTVAIRYDDTRTSEDKLKAAIEELGYKVSGVVQK